MLTLALRILPFGAVSILQIGAVPTVNIAPGVNLPLLSLGTGSGMLKPAVDVTEAVRLWLISGGSAVDTAYDYGDEERIAKGIVAAGAGAPFVTTKIPCTSYAKAAAHINSNLQQLGTDFTDLLLIHFPCRSPFVGSTADTWRAIEDALTAGKARAIGVSNFDVDDLHQLRKTARRWPPAVNQCSLSVGYHDDATIRYCDQQRITYMGYSPLCGGVNGSSCTHHGVLGLPEVKAVALGHNVSEAQVALKWIVQQGRPLATAVWRPDYMLQDLDLWSWGNLSSDEMARLTAV